MDNVNAHAALRHYGQIKAVGRSAYANPHRLVQMLLEGALERIAAAKGHMTRREVAEKATRISETINIIEGLRMSLNLEAGGDIAQNLDALYDYMGRRLLEANAENDPLVLDETASLLREIKTAWDAISDEDRDGQAAGRPVERPAVG